MTNPPPSPYGPADPAGENPPSPYSTPQPPYNAAHYYPQEQLPYGYTAVGPTPPKRSNGPGLAALVIGIASIVLAFIPFANFFSFLLGPAGIIVGIVGLVLADRPRRQAIWGLVLSGISMIIAFIMIFVYTFGFLFAVGGAVNEATESAPRASELATPPPLSSPTDVLTLGTVVELSDVSGEPAYETSVTASVLDANSQVLAVAGNTEPPAGMQWAMATVAVTALTDVHFAPAADIAVEYLSPDGHAFSTLDEYAMAPAPALDALTDLGVGETATGNVVIAIPSDDPFSGFWILAFSLGGSGDGPSCFEVE